MKKTYINRPEFPKLGDEYIIVNGCPNCQSDLKICHGVSSMCVNWQHPSLENVYNKNGTRECDFALMSG